MAERKSRNPEREEDLEEQGKKGGRKKKEKPPKKEKKKKERKKKEKVPKEKKGGSTILGFLAGLLFVLVLLAGAFALFHFNLFEARVKVIEYLNVEEEMLAAQWSIYNNEWERLKSDKEDFNKEKEAILKLETELISREAEVTQKEADVESRLEEATALSQLLSGQVADLNHTVSLLSSMDAAEAAGLLEALPDRAYAIILFQNMEEKTQSTILAECTTEFAAEIITKMGIQS